MKVFIKPRTVYTVTTEDGVNLGDFSWLDSWEGMIKLENEQGETLLTNKPVFPRKDEPGNPLKPHGEAATVHQSSTSLYAKIIGK